MTDSVERDERIAADILIAALQANAIVSRGQTASSRDASEKIAEAFKIILQAVQGKNQP